MSAETKKVLEMLAQGKISTEEAERLLEKLSGASASDASAKEKAAESGAAPNKPRVMRIVVERPGQEQVNIRLPLSLARTGTRLMAVLPIGVTEKLADLGIDATTFGTMTGAMEDMHIDVDKGNGKRVKIFCE
jgi:hypothetical protein